MASHLCVLVLVVAASLCEAAPGSECNVHSRDHYPVGTCNFASCNIDHGPGRTHCHHGDCICKSGSCRGPDKKKCLSDTGGTCVLYGCSSSRGDTVCHKAHCLCRHLHEESVDGVCQDTLMLYNMTATQLLATNPDLQFQASDGFTVPALCFALVAMLCSALLGVVFFMRRRAAKTAPTGYAHLNA